MSKNLILGGYIGSFRNHFKNKYFILPVVHCENRVQTLNNAKITHGEGADGIFLINHKVSYRSLFQYYIMVKENLELFYGGESLRARNAGYRNDSH